jgi:hypothetical protein
MRTQPDILRQGLPQPVQGVALMQRQRPPRASHRDAAAEGRLAGKEVLKMKAAPAAVTEDEFIIRDVQADIEGGFPAGPKMPTGAGVFV